MKNKLSIDFNSIIAGEAEIADVALKEYWSRGQSDLKCPRCGGKFAYSVQGNSSRIEYEKKCGMGEVSRGI